MKKIYSLKAIGKTMNVPDTVWNYLFTLKFFYPHKTIVMGKRKKKVKLSDISMHPLPEQGKLFNVPAVKVEPPKKKGKVEKPNNY